jgi:hypothetical protein
VQAAARPASTRAGLRRSEPLQVKQDRRRDQRPGQTAATGLIRAGHEPHAQTPIKPDQLASWTATASRTAPSTAR